ncbi:MAG: OmpA family protein, partial [Endomicrobia bacterium]|nr:OmpA family protein [Endomicrobiia bacterium]
KKAALEAQKVQAEEEAKAKRIEEEAKITKEISDADLAKQKAEAEARRNRPMLKTYTLTTHFDTNSYFLSEEDKRQISKIAEEVKNYDYKKIAIEGHTDSTGSKETNKRLSRQRARSVYDEFINSGIPAEKISYEGFADTMPVQSNATAEGRAANRRVEVFVE